MVQSGEEYREKNRKRLQRFYEKQRQQDKKRISALVSGEAYNFLMEAKDKTGDSMSTLIDQAVLKVYRTDTTNAQVKADTDQAEGKDTKQDQPVSEEDTVSYEDKVTPDIDNTALVESTGEDQAEDQEKHETEERESDTATDDQGSEVIPDCTGKTIGIDERDRLLVAVAEALPGRKHAQERVDLLNRKSVPVSSKAGHYGGKWDNKKFSDNLRFAKKRLGTK